MALLAILCAGAPALAGIASTSANVNVVSHPTGNLASGSLESDTSFFLWAEGALVNPGAQSLGHVGAGLVNSNGSANPATVTRSYAESYMLHFDKVGSSGGNVIIQNQAITFTETIIGVWFSNSGTNGLPSSDGQWAPAGLTYTNGLAFRPFELGTSGNDERFVISADLKTITILNARTAGNGTDQLRILVNPEPGTFALMGLGVLGLASLVLRRRRAARRAA